MQLIIILILGLTLYAGIIIGRVQAMKDKDNKHE